MINSRRRGRRRAHCTSTRARRACPERRHQRTAPRRDGRANRSLAAGEPAPNHLAADQQPANQPAGGSGRDWTSTFPPEIPGSEARRIELPKEPAAKQREIERLFPALPPLAAEPIPLPGPNGRPYTLADLQQIAAANSPQLRQAAADVEAARGNMIQANAYPNPTVSYQFTPSNNGSTPGADGVGIDQTIKTGGKLALANRRGRDGPAQRRTGLAEGPQRSGHPGPQRLLRRPRGQGDGAGEQGPGPLHG